MPGSDLFAETDIAALPQLVAEMRGRRKALRAKRVRLGGRDAWLKIALDEGWRKRLSKGAPRAALAAEVATLERRRASGVPVPDVLAQGEDYVVLSDCGPTLGGYVGQSAEERAERQKAFSAAGAMLARLHRLGTGHGRGKIKDFCWDGSQIRLIDFEAVRADYDVARDAHREIVNFVHYSYCFGFYRGFLPFEEVRSFIRSYRAETDGSVLLRAQDWARRHWWLTLLAAPVAGLTASGRAQDVKAIIPALSVLAYFLFEN